MLEMITMITEIISILHRMNNSIEVMKVNINLRYAELTIHIKDTDVELLSFKVSHDQAWYVNRLDSKIMLQTGEETMHPTGKEFVTEWRRAIDAALRKV